MKPTPLHLSLAARILEDVQAGRIDPGARLKELDLAAALGVSRTPVRAALRYLAARGVAERVEGGGIVLRAGGDSVAALADETAQAAGDEDTLRVAIARDRLRGDLPERFSEADLIRRYAMSRARVVQALGDLAELGMIERNRGHGWRFLPAIDSAEARAASYRFRLLVEPAALLEPGFALDARWIAEMEARHRAMLEARWDARAAVALFEMNAAFHEGLAAASGNRFMALAIQQQNRLRRLLNYDWTYGRERVVVSCSEHLAILAALDAGERTRAADLLRAHLTRAGELRRAFP
jgi:DNA-binding GntR family transcriptional regulator